MESKQPSQGEVPLGVWLAVVLGVGSLLALAAAALGTRWGLWHFRTGFGILKYAAFAGLAGFLFGLVAAAIAQRRRQTAGLVLALLGLICGAVSFGIPLSFKFKAQQYPRIHDISSDLNHPPQLVALVRLRRDPAPYGGVAVAAQQLKGYPDIKTLVLPKPMEGAFRAALEVARELNWELVAAAPLEGRIEAVDTTFWFGFKDDIVIRITPAGERSLVDIRSVSRVGISDLGTNARRIRLFMRKLAHQSGP